MRRILPALTGLLALDLAHDDARRRQRLRRGLAVVVRRLRDLRQIVDTEEPHIRNARRRRQPQRIRADGRVGRDGGANHGLAFRVSG